MLGTERSDDDFLEPRGVEPPRNYSDELPHAPLGFLLVAAELRGFRLVDLINEDHATFKIDAELEIAKQHDERRDKHRAENETDFPAIVAHSRRIGHEHAQY